MDAALAASALFMGLTGSLHCASMCGPAFGATAARSAPGGLAGTTLSMHAGRLLSYSAAGALVASSTSALGTLQAAGPLLRPVWTLIHVAAIALGLALVWKGRAIPRWLARDGPATVGKSPDRPTPTSFASSRACRRRVAPAWPGCAGPASRAGCSSRRFWLPRCRPGHSRAQR